MDVWEHDADQTPSGYDPFEKYVSTMLKSRLHEGKVTYRSVERLTVSVEGTGLIRRSKRESYNENEPGLKSYIFTDLKQ
jgi:hypothetical protein